MMHIIYIPEDDDQYPNMAPGYYVIDEDGNILKGPFESEEEALEWIEEQTPNIEDAPAPASPTWKPPSPFGS